MVVMLEYLIALKLLEKACRFLSSKRITKFLNIWKWIEVGKLISNRRNYYKIKITEDSIEQKQLVNDSIRKSQRLYKWFYHNF